MMEPLFGKRTRFPSPHARRGHRHPVNAADAIGNIPTDLLETPTPEELTSASDMIFTLKAVPGLVIAAIFCERSSCNTKQRILGEFANQEIQIIGIERHVRIEIADNFEVN